MYNNTKDIKYETYRFINKHSLIIMTTLKYLDALFKQCRTIKSVWKMNYFSLMTKTEKSYYICK
jgi:hypothetical protein